MSNFPFFRIFPQSWTGHYCGYCGKQHGRQEWRDIDFPGDVFNSKKCLKAAIREKNAFWKKRTRNMPKTATSHKLARSNKYKMDGKTEFSQPEADAIRDLLKEKFNASRSRQKTIRGKIRNQYKFYISDFTSSSSGFNHYDFDNLINRNRIRIID